MRLGHQSEMLTGIDRLALVFGLLAGGLSTNPIALAEPQRPAVQVSGRDGGAQVTTSGGRMIFVEEPGQVGVSAIQVGPDGRTAGWLVDYRDPDSSNRYSGKLVIWRDERLARTFSTAKSFYSWSFNAGSSQVAYHTGPLHGERSSHCELHDVKTGRLVAQWDGDLSEVTTRPAWAAQLTR